MFYLHVNGGICNRLRAIASGIKLAEEYSGDMVVYWCKNKELYANFEDLFEIDSKIKVSVYSIEESDKQIEDKMKIQLGEEVCYKESFQEKNVVEFIKYYKGNQGKKDVFLSTCYNFYDSKDYSWLVIKKELQKRIDAIISQYGNNCIGLHIRRTDNIKAIEESPIELFIKIVKEEIKKDNNVKFFLATDDIECKNNLVNMFQDKIIVNNMKAVTRETEIGIVDAVIDFMALANTKKIYGSYWSSFSEVAADMGKVKLNVIRKDAELIKAYKLARMNESRCQRLMQMLRTNFDKIRLPEKLDIYGAGDIGKILYDKIKGRCIIECFIDANPREASYDGIHIIKIDEYRSHSEKKIIIIPTYAINEIRSALAVKCLADDSQIISLENLLNESWKYDKC